MKLEIRGATLDERPAVQHLIDLAFDAESYGSSLAHPCTCVGSCDDDPYDRPENTRVLFINGELISAMHVLEREAYVYGTRTGFGIITDVATHPDYRRRGYMHDLMTDTEAHLRDRGLCYGLLMGGFTRYGGSLGWRWCGEQRTTLDRVVLLPTFLSTTKTVEATEEDIPFLAHVYEARYASRFGPVVRSAEYWRRWSLPHTSEGRYFIVRRDGHRVGYFHMGNSVDEFGWLPEVTEAADDVLSAMAAQAAQQSQPYVRLWAQEADQPLLTAIHSRFGEVPSVYVDAMGQNTEERKPSHMLARLWHEGSGLMVKWLRSGPGLLASVTNTEELTAVMAQHQWMMFDGDIA